MIGENLKKAEEWLERAIVQEEKGSEKMMNRCLDKMVELEKAGVEAGESWE